MSASASASPGEKPFNALASLPELGGGMKPGKITIGGGRLRFDGEAGSVEWALAEIQLHLGGHNDSQIFLFRAADPKATLSTGDLSLLEHPAFQHSALREQAARTIKKSRTIPRGLLGCGVLLFLLLAGIVVLFAMRARVSSALAERVPVEWEKEFGESVLKDISSKQKLVTTNAVYAARIRAITNALLPVLAADARFQFQFHVIHDTNINAFAVPGGQVFILTGLLDASKRPEQLAGVLAHEIAHVTRRHSLRNIISSAGLWLTLSALFGNAEGLTAVLAEGSGFLLDQKFSRDFEREADDTGWEYLVKANVDPRGMIEFFQTIKEEQEKSTAGKLANSLDFLATHPATDERMARLRSKWEALPRKTGFKDLASQQ